MGHSLRVEGSAFRQLSSGKIQALGTGFEKSLEDQLFDIETPKVIEDLMEDITVFQFIRRGEEVLPSNSWWACTRTHAIGLRTQAPSLASRETDLEPSIQKLRVQCVTTTLIVYLCYENSYNDSLLGHCH